MTGLTMRLFIILAFSLTAVISASPSVLAQETFVEFQEPGWLGLKNKSGFSIRVNDGVKDGCWTNIEAAKNAVAVEMQRSGYKVDVSDKGGFINRIWLDVIGYEIANSTCVIRSNLLLISLGISAFADGDHRVISFHGSQIWSADRLLSGPKNGMNRRMRDAFVELTQQLLLDIPKQRRKVLEAVRESAEADKDEKPETYRYWMQFPE